MYRMTRKTTGEVIVRCSCGQRVRLQAGRIWHRARCSTCRRNPDPLMVKRLFAVLICWVTALVAPTAPPGISGSPAGSIPQAPRPSAPPLPPTGEWENDLRRLAKQAWNHTGSPSLQLLGSALPPTADSDNLPLILEAIYRHVRKTCPGLREVRKLPRVSYGSCYAAGTFGADPEGFTEVFIDPGLQPFVPVVRAVLCHEAMHHILDVSGIAGREVEANEKLADRAMFICGLGDVFLLGQERLSDLSEGTYRKSHLGYHTRADYEAMRTWAAWAWQHKTAIRVGDVEDALWKRVNAKYPDVKVRDRLIGYYEGLHPSKPKRWVLERMLEDRN